MEGEGIQESKRARKGENGASSSSDRNGSDERLREQPPEESGGEEVEISRVEDLVTEWADEAIAQNGG